MKKNSKFLGLISLILIAVCFSLSGCGGTATENTRATSTGLKPYEIKWYFLCNSEQRDTPLVENEINKYLKDKINATVKLNGFDWSTYEQKMKAIIASGEEFDICFTANANLMNDYVQNARNGAFLPLNDLVNKYAPKTKALLGDQFLRAAQVDGVNYGIPCNKERARDFGFVYNKTLANKYNLDMTKVKSYADLEPMLKTIKQNEPNTVVLQNLGKPTSLIPWNPSSSDEVGVLLPDGKFHNQYETPDFKAAYETARKYYTEGYYRTDAAVEHDHNSQIKVGNFFAYITNLKPGYVDEQNVNYKQAGFQAGQIDITPPTITNADTMGSLQAISRTSKDPARAMMFLELVNTDKYLNNLLNFGIEGKHYTKTSDNTIELVKDSGYYMGMGWMFGNQMLNYLLPTENPQKWEIYDQYNKSAVPALDLGFIFNPENVKTEEAACNNVIKEYVPVLSCGAVDPSIYLPEFLSKLQKAGADKVIAEKQKQFDEWKQKNK